MMKAEVGSCVTWLGRNNFVWHWKLHRERYAGDLLLECCDIWRRETEEDTEDLTLSCDMHKNEYYL